MFKQGKGKTWRYRKEKKENKRKNPLKIGHKTIRQKVKVKKAHKMSKHRLDDVPIEKSWLGTKSPPIWGFLWFMMVRQIDRIFFPYITFESHLVFFLKFESHLVVLENSCR